MAPHVLGTLFALALLAGAAAYVAGLRGLLGSETFAMAHGAYLRAILAGSAFVLCAFAFGGRHTPFSIATILLMVLGLAYAPGSMRPGFDLTAGAVAGLGLARLILAARGLPKAQVAGVLALGLGVAGLLALVNLRHNYAVPVGLEMALLGLTHHDTLFHAAVAQNLGARGIASIGADGLVPMAYHVFSHRVIGGFTAWLGTEMLHGYGLFLSIVAIPVLLGLMLQTAAQLYRPAATALEAWVAMFTTLGWLAFGGAIMWHSYFSSESYILALWMLLLAVLLLHQLATRAQPGWGGQALVLGLLAACVGMAALSKVSVGAVLACAVAMGIATAGRLRPMAVARAVLAGLLPALVVYLANPVSGGEDAALLRPFAFLRYEEPALYAALFALVMTYLAKRHFPTDHSARVLVLALGTGMWAGLAASYLLNTPAGAQYYFSDPGTWLGLMLVPVLGLAPKWLTRRPQGRQFGPVAAFILAMMALHDRSLDGVERLGTYRAALAALPETASAGESAVQHTAVGQALLASRAGAFDAIVVSAAHAGFWRSQPVCWAASYMLPALTGKPMLRGLPPEGPECEITPYYGLASYDPAQSRAPTDLDAGALCAHALPRDARRLLVITAQAHWITTCPDGPGQTAR